MTVVARVGDVLGATAALGATVLAGSLVEARAFVLRRVAAPVLAPGERPLRVLHLSDLHVVPRQRAKRAWVRGLAALEPDLTVVTGDMLSHPDAVPAVLEDLDGLLGRHGVFVLGSNDYFAPTPRNPLRYFRGPSEGQVEQVPLPVGDLVAGLTGRGWLDLDNTRARLEVAGRTVRLVGVDDPHLDRDRMPAPDPAEPDDGSLRLGVAHAPYLRVLDAMAADGADLVLAGHTHGGQVCVPGVGALVTNCDLPRRYAKGLFAWPVPREADPVGRAPTTWVNVSAGIGTSPYTPVRLACRPEATLLTLVPRA